MVVVVHVEVVDVTIQTVDVCPAMAGGHIWEQMVGMVDPDHDGQLVDLQMESWDGEMHYLCQVDVAPEVIMNRQIGVADSK